MFSLFSFCKTNQTPTVTTGQGEYVVFYPQTNKQMTQELFDKAYSILNRYSPSSLIERGNAHKCAQRYESTLKNIKLLDKDLEIAFIPRTLFELVFIRRCILEDIKNEKICPEVEVFEQRQWRKTTLELCEHDKNAYNNEIKERIDTLNQKKCWHLGYFEDAGDIDHPGVKHIAFRLNQLIVKRFKPTKEGFTYKELKLLAKKQTHFLQTYHSNWENGRYKKETPEKVSYIKLIDTSDPGPSTNFGCEKSMGKVSPMGIRNEEDERLILKAVKRDCSAEALTHFIIYRGVDDYQDDAPNHHIKKHAPYSLSFGSSLFAGCVFDGGATAFHYIRNCDEPYALLVPFEKVESSPFYIPPTNTICQLFGNGEVFHGRTKAWKGSELSDMCGISGINDDQRDHLASNLTREELIEQFENYIKVAIHLKPKKQHPEVFETY